MRFISGIEAQRSGVLKGIGGGNGLVGGQNISKPKSIWKNNWFSVGGMFGVRAVLILRIQDGHLRSPLPREGSRAEARHYMCSTSGGWLEHIVQGY